MPPLDGKALIWYVRNSLFFEQRLAEKKNMMLLHYADITSDPPRIMKDVYHFIDVSYPGDHIVAAVHGKSVGLGNTVELDPEIETLCEDMWNRFQQLTP
jgi:hypothetical protein